MTETQIRQKVVSTAVSYLGCKESNGSHKKIIDIYNKYSPLAAGYKVKYTDPWCATFVSTISILCNLMDIMPTECSCSRMIALYKKINRWHEKDDYVPSIGDIMMYDWDDNGNGENTGDPEHVGIVTAISNGTITVIEGNKNNAVEYRQMKVNGRYIRGYCLPDYASKAKDVKIDKTTSTSSSKTNSSSSTIQKNSLDKNVKWNGYVSVKNGSVLNVRTWAGTSYPKCSFSPLNNKTVVGVCDSIKDKDGLIWYYIKYNDNYGFVSSKYIKKSKSTTSLNTGSKLELSKVALYASSYAIKKASVLTGNYYIWDSEIVKNRIRITNKTANVGKVGQVTGWINVKDAKNALM